MSAGLQGAIETAPVTRLHERHSYDPADFAVPAGREEEWRFTPLGLAARPARRFPGGAGREGNGGSRPGP